jgi:urate oxidase
MSKIKKFEVLPTQYTPKVILNPDSKDFSFSGNSMPENSENFYVPILNWTKEFMEVVSGNEPLHVNMRLNYYNSSSMRYITDWFTLLAEIHTKFCKVQVNWYYEDGDDLMQESGSEIAELVNLPVNLVEIQ